MEFKTQHNLPFLIAEYPNVAIKYPHFSQDDCWMAFKVGTCDGLWRSTNTSYEILAVINQEKGNGHLNDVFQWFENSCMRDNKTLKILEVWNKRFQIHLREKRGFLDIGSDNYEKTFKK